MDDPTVFVAIAGLKGYMPAYNAAFSSEDAAIDSLCDLHELGRVRRKRLKDDCYLDLEDLSLVEVNQGHSFGNEYCEVAEYTLTDLGLPLLPLGHDLQDWLNQHHGE